MTSTSALLRPSFHPFRPIKSPSRSRGGAPRVGAMRRAVDENMIVLRKRIHEMKGAEAGWELPAEWMEWERRLYRGSYDGIICDAMANLQSYLMETRPSLALALLLLLALSVSTSAAMLVYNLLGFGIFCLSSFLSFSS